MNKNANRTTTMLSEFRILTAILGVLYSIFTITAFVKLRIFWGINFLYYQPLSIKLLFIASGGAAFVPTFNNLIFRVYLRIADTISRIQLNFQNKYLRLIYLFFLAGVFAVLFYVFRVVSLYHAPMGAVYFMMRDVPIMQYYKEWFLISDKYTLLLFWAAWRYVFNNILPLAPYWMLAVPSILCGVFFVACLDIFLRRLKLKPLLQLLVIILIFTQAITYYFFGFANYYGPIPFVIFLYLLSVVTYFKNSGSVYYPLAFGFAAILVHFGALFILPSMLYLIIHKYRKQLSAVNNLFTFSAPAKAALFFGIILTASYVLLNIIKLGHIDLQEFTVPPFSVTKRYGYPLFSSAYAIHLFNTLLLNSPVGIVLFLVFIKDIHLLTIYNGLKYALLWIAIGGILHNVLLLPQTIFAWDVFAWASAGYVIAGALLFLNAADRIKSAAYVITLVITHALVYFGAWIALNNNVYASVLNYLDTAETFDPQFSWCMQIIRKDPRDIKGITKLLHQLESRAQTKEDYYELGTNYYALAKDAESSQRILSIYSERVEDAIKENPNNAWNYYNYFTFLELPVIQKTPEIDSLIDWSHRKTVEIEPTNTHYCLLYAGYLLHRKDYQTAFPFLLRADSLYSTQGYSELRTNFTHSYIKCKLSYASYLSGDITGTISYFIEAEQMVMDLNDSDAQLTYEDCMYSFAALGNIAYADSMLNEAHRKGFLENIDAANLNDELIRDNFIQLNIDFKNSKEFVSRLMINSLNDGNRADFEKLLTFMTLKNNDPNFDLYRCLLGLIKTDSQTLIASTSYAANNDSAGHKYGFFTGLGYLQEKKYDSALANFQKGVSYSSNTQALWLIPYTMLLQGNILKAGEWIRKYENEGATSEHFKSTLKFIGILSDALQKRDLTPLLKHLNLPQTNHQFSTANLFLPHLEELLQKCSLQATDKQAILEFAAMQNIRIIKDLIEK